MSAVAYLKGDESSPHVYIEGTPKDVLRLCRRLLRDLDFNISHAVATLMVQVARSTSTKNTVKCIYQVGGFFTFLMRKGLERQSRVPFAHLEVAPSRQHQVPYLDITLFIFNRHGFVSPWPIRPQGVIAEIGG